MDGAVFERSAALSTHGCSSAALRAELAAVLNLRAMDHKALAHSGRGDPSRPTVTLKLWPGPNVSQGRS